LKLADRCTDLSCKDETPVNWEKDAAVVTEFAEILVSWRGE
jgi:hypothetical protein